MVPAFVAWERRTGMPRRACLGSASPAIRPAEIAAAALDSVCYQTRDLVEAMRGDGARSTAQVRCGMVVKTRDAAPGRHGGPPVERPKVIETTAWGSLPGRLQDGALASLDALCDLGARAGLSAGRTGAVAETNAMPAGRNAVRRAARPEATYTTSP